ncbi:MAG: P1 family peptidase [Hyphomicrobiaceae bacterium]|nr:P1 family peptidase [Hyphomicrobiaceae bacterium]
MPIQAQRNLITDVDGISVGNAQDDKLRSGVTVLLCDKPMTAAVDIRGGGPGTRDVTTLLPEGAVQEVHALCLSGGSAFGLDAATGVQSFLREKGQGFPVGDACVPIVPQAILFDLLNGGDKDWGKRPPYQDLAYAACDAASANFDLGTFGAGYGATTVNLKGGLGSASAKTADGITIGALAAVNAVGSVTVGDGPHFWAAPFEIDGEFGGHGLPGTFPPGATGPRFKGGPGENTTLVVVATDAGLDRLMLRRLAIMASTGMARAIYPVHCPIDGDVVFAVSNGQKKLPDPIYGLSDLGSLGANVVARAIARGVHEATAFQDKPKGLPAYKDKFGAGTA